MASNIRNFDQTVKETMREVFENKRAWKRHAQECTGDCPLCEEYRVWVDENGDAETDTWNTLKDFLKNELGMDTEQIMAMNEESK